jgi:hypothetical protein
LNSRTSRRAIVWSGVSLDRVVEADRGFAWLEPVINRLLIYPTAREFHTAH